MTSSGVPPRSRASSTTPRFSSSGCEGDSATEIEFQFEPIAAFRMAVDGAPDELPPVIGEFEQLLRGVGYDGPIGALERFAYYERTRAAYAIVSTGERRYWGNLILKKGAIAPETATGDAA